MKLRHCIWGVVVVLAFLYSPEANACDCEGPGATFLPSGGTLPANAKGLAWSTPYSLLVDKDGKTKPPNNVRFKVELIDKQSSNQVPFVLDILSDQMLIVRPKKGISAGDRYRFSFQVGGQSALWESVVEVTISNDVLEKQNSPARLHIGPLEIGKVTISGEASCSTTIEAGKRSIEIVLPPSVQKYKQSLLYNTFVDGKPWRPSPFLCAHIPIGRSWVDFGKDLLYSACIEKRSYSGLRKGTHKVRMTATLPGVGVIVDSGEVEVEMGCEWEDKR